MGRLGRYRRLKACDPFNKKATKLQENNAEREEQFFISCFKKEKDEDKLPKKTRLLLKAQSLMKTNRRKRMNNGGQKEDLGMKKPSNSKHGIQLQEQLPFENFYKFSRRLAENTREMLFEHQKQQLWNDSLDSSKKREKRKLFLKERKMKKKKRDCKKQNSGEENVERYDQIAFGEVALQPPILEAFPKPKKNAAENHNHNGNSGLVSQHKMKVKQSNSHRKENGFPSFDFRLINNSDESGERERKSNNELQLLREQIIERYREKKRRNASCKNS